MSRDQRQKVFDWPAGERPMGEEPPWAWFDYMKLRETLETIVSGMEAATQQIESSPPSEPQPESDLPLVVSNESPDSAAGLALLPDDEAPGL